MPPNKNVSVHMQIKGKRESKEPLLTWSLGNTLSGFYQNFALQDVCSQPWMVAVSVSIKKSFVFLQRNGRSLGWSPKSTQQPCLSGSRYKAITQEEESHFFSLLVKLLTAPLGRTRDWILSSAITRIEETTCIGLGVGDTEVKNRSDHSHFILQFSHLSQQKRKGGDNGWRGTAWRPERRDPISVK